jgi:hypothetical protein
LFAETADRLRLSDTVVEKDFWVCWTLKQIFSIDALKSTLLFKGGTSLSKIFRAINRFSEDIDLAVDYTALGFVGARDPRQEGISRTKQIKILEEMLDACRLYIRSAFLPLLSKRFQEVLADRDWALTISPNDPHIVQFRYPSSVANRLAYISPQVILELGTHAEFIPRDNFPIRSFAAEQFPQVFEEPEVFVTALLAKRTFWEKATILHAEYPSSRRTTFSRPLFSALLRPCYAGTKRHQTNGISGPRPASHSRSPQANVLSVCLGPL